MTDEERKELREKAEAATPVDGFINRHMQVTVPLVDLIALLDEHDKLRGHCSLLEVRERQATEMCTWLTGENQRLRDALKLAEHLDGEIDSLLEQSEEDVVEVAHLQQQLAAMTAARDEACEIADRFADLIANSNPYADKLARIARISTLRKVGAP